MADWAPAADLIGVFDEVKVSASDAETLPGGCGMHAALKVRKSVKGASWGRRADWDTAFVLGVIRDTAVSLHGDPRLGSYPGMREAIKAALATQVLHPGIRVFVEHALESYLDAHDELATANGPLTFWRHDPVTGTGAAKRRLTVWAPLYVDGKGLREVRRTRFGSARPGGKTGVWAAVAAHVAATTLPAGETTRVRVVEIGLLDGSTQVLFDGTPEDVRLAYETSAKDGIARLVDGTSLVPGRQCGACKMAGFCPACGRLDGHLGQDTPGVETRSVSASDLEVYQTCPAQWFLRQSNLPREYSDHPAATRGRLVHAWLRAAHARGTTCTAAEVPPPGTAHDHVGGLSPADYEIAYPYLVAHLGHCLMRPDVSMAILDRDLYGYDLPADVVVAARPDLLLVRADGVPVLRETKTTDKPLPEKEAEAYDRWFQVAWDIGLLASGAGAVLGSPEPAVVELEVLTPAGGHVYRWHLDNAAVVGMARTEVASRAEDWHHDKAWVASPGPHCGWCPVSRWCPSADPSAGTAASGAGTVVHGYEPSVAVAADDDPPF